MATEQQEAKEAGRKDHKPLRVYKASAGSGKTFTLATEYIELLIKNPQSYRSILAVTFTNKATQEMKERILSQLYGLWKGLDDSRAYEAKICADLGVESALVSERAGIALRLLLHNYSYFRMETIDSFFQSVLRNLARELGLTANLRVELGDNEVESQAVDRLIESLGPDDKEMRWITEYIEGNISQGESWDVLGKIKSFGLNIFKDVYQREGESIMRAAADDAMFEWLIGQLRKERVEAKSIMAGKATEFFDILDHYGLSVDDFSKKEKGVAGFFIKLRRGEFSPKIVGANVRAARDDAQKWVPGTGIRRRTAARAIGRKAATVLVLASLLTRDQIVSIVEAELRPLLIEALEELPRQWSRLQSAEMTLSNINQLRLLGSIENAVRDIDEEACRFLLCHTQHALSNIIDGSDSPFIFEKIGCQLEHIMIDEFQDTSTTQWKNFKVLLDECMSHRGNTNLIVGDVKQSIYRWRNGDWRLLANIEGEWDAQEEMVGVSNLGVNYRSRGNIVAFNNAFFEAAAQKEYERLRETDEERAEMLRAAYADVRQETAAGKEEGGRVEISVLPKKKKTKKRQDEEEAEEEEEEDGMPELIAQKVEQLLEAGSRQSDIAILIRENKRASEIAAYFAQRLPLVKLVSDEAFRLDASEAVNMLIDAIRLLADPTDGITRASLTRRYATHILGGMEEGSLLPDDNGRRDDLLPEAFGKSMQALRSLPLAELTERLYNMFSLGEIDGEGAYISAFHDCLTEFLKDNAGDLRQFVDYWDETMAEKKISCDYPDGIRIMTIHKSKGLEFESVIVPYCDWQLTKGELMWCKSEEEPYNKLPLIPIKYSENVKDTVFKDYYLEETMQIAVDNLNMLYVAFTRASANLFVICQRKDQRFRQQLISACLPEVAKSIGADTKDLGKDDSTERLTYGSLYIGGKKEARTTENIFLQPSTAADISVESHDGNVTFCQSNDSRYFVEGDDDGLQTSYIKTGSLLHNVLAQIATADDMERVVSQMDCEGLTGEGESSRQALLDMLRERIGSRKVSDWFAPHWRLFNECTILSVDPESGEVVRKRPDRAMYDPDKDEMVIIDYKFGRQRPEYHKQVGEYMQLVRGMGYKNVRGYLWFVYTNDVVEVNA